MKRFALVAYAFFIIGAAFPQKADIRYNLKEGVKYRQNGTVTIKITQSMEGFVVPSEMTMKMDIEATVKSISNGVYDMEMRYIYLRYGMISPYINVSFGSDDPDIDQLAGIMKGMTASTFMVRMTDRGKIVDVMGLDTLFENIAVSLDVSPEERQALIEQVRQSFGEEQIKSIFQMSASYPEYPVSPGDMWTTETQMANQPVPMKMNVTYEYKGIEDGNWVIDATALFSDLGNIPLGLNILTNDIKYKFQINTLSGLMVDCNMLMSMEMETSEYIPEHGIVKIQMKYDASATVKSSIIEQ